MHRVFDVIGKIHSTVWEKRFTQGIFDGCWYGCSMACAKGADGLVLKTGPYKGHMVTVDGPEYETLGAVGSDGSNTYTSMTVYAAADYDYYQVLRRKLKWGEW